MLVKKKHLKKRIEELEKEVELLKYTEESSWSINHRIFMEGKEYIVKIIKSLTNCIFEIYSEETGLSYHYVV